MKSLIVYIFLFLTTLSGVLIFDKNETEKKDKIDNVTPLEVQTIVYNSNADVRISSIQDSILMEKEQTVKSQSKIEKTIAKVEELNNIEGRILRENYGAIESVVEEKNGDYRIIRTQIKN